MGPKTDRRQWREPAEDEMGTGDTSTSQHQTWGGAGGPPGASKRRVARCSLQDPKINSCCFQPQEMNTILTLSFSWKGPGSLHFPQTPSISPAFSLVAVGTNWDLTGSVLGTCWSQDAGVPGGDTDVSQDPVIHYSARVY